ncbi:MAG: hypothetical protein ACFHVJ_09465 [Aestuariibacter sp.]
MWLNTLSLLNSGLVLVSLYGICAQLNRLWLGRKPNHCTEISGGASHILSLNQFTVSFYAYLSFFTYGAMVEPFNHIMVWPRLIAALLLGLILLEIWRDRKNKISMLCLLSVVISLIISLLLLIFGDRYQDSGKNVATLMIVVFTAFLAQGYAHQIALVIKAGDTGAIDNRAC